MSFKHYRLYGILCLALPPAIFLLSIVIFAPILMQMGEPGVSIYENEEALALWSFFKSLITVEVLAVFIGFFSGIYLLTHGDSSQKELKFHVSSSKGKAKNSKIPTEIKGWNWGAAGFSWIWGMKYNVSIALLDLIFPLMLFGWIVLGKKGNEWAWRAGQWKSVSAFQTAQKKWAIWGLLFLIPRVAISTFLAFFIQCSLVGLCSA